MTKKITPATKKTTTPKIAMKKAKVVKAVKSTTKKSK